MMEESKKVAELILSELNKAKKYKDSASRDFLTFTDQYLKEDGSVDFDKIEADNRMNDYRALERYTERASFEYAMVKDYIRSYSSEPFAEKEVRGLDFASLAEKHDNITKEHRSLPPSQSKVKVSRAIGDSVYEYEKNVGEIFTAEQETNLYKGLLDKEVAKVSTTKLDSPAFQGVRQEACTDIVKKMNEKIDLSYLNYITDKEQKPLPEETRNKINEQISGLSKSGNPNGVPMYGGTSEVTATPIVNTFASAMKAESSIKPITDESLNLNEKKHLDNIREASQGAQWSYQDDIGLIHYVSGGDMHIDPEYDGYLDKIKETSQQAPVLTPEQQAEAAVNAMIANTQTENTPSKSLGGFTATGLIAIMTALVSIGLVILGTVLIK